MATVNFSVPDDVKSAFNAAFAGQNKSAVIAALMLQAIEEKQGLKRQAEAIDRMLERRSQGRPASWEEIQAARTELRT